MTYNVFGGTLNLRPTELKQKFVTAIFTGR